MRSVYISFFVCVQKGYRISNLKISEAFVIDFEVTFLCDFVLGVLNLEARACSLADSEIYLSIPLTDLVVVLNTMFIVFNL